MKFLEKLCCAFAYQEFFLYTDFSGLNANLRFEPTREIPALQYFEGVDMNGMAMKAGLKPGDFLLEVRFFVFGDFTGSWREEISHSHSSWTPFMALKSRIVAVSEVAVSSKVFCLQA